MKKLIFIALLLASDVRGQVVVAAAGDRIAVAREGRLETYDETGTTLIATQASVAHPSRIIAGSTSVAVLDTWSNRVQLGSQILTTPESPVDATFIDGSLYVLARDAAALERIAPDGTRSSIALAGDPAFLRESAGKLLVYSRREGVVQEITTNPFTVTRRIAMPTGAADFETDGRTGYLVYPEDALLRTFSLTSFEATGEVKTGAVPVDIALASASSVLSPAKLTIADPSSKRLWSVEGRQSATAAFGRGFLRGLTGLGGRRARDSEFPTGIDRVETRDGRTIAYDSSTGTLYRIEKAKPVALGRDIGPAAFALTPRGVAIWESGRLRVVPHSSTGMPVAQGKAR